MNFLALTPNFFRGGERSIIVCGGIIAIYLGYKLYRFGIDEGMSNLTFENKLFRFIVAGPGPGVILIAMGGIILILALFTGEAQHTDSHESFTTQSEPSGAAAKDKTDKAIVDFFDSGGRKKPEPPESR